LLSDLQPTRECRVDWTALVPASDWAHYARVMDECDHREVRYVLGGGLAFSELSGRSRNTKDLDLYILPGQKELAIEALLAAGFHDYFDELPYDRTWIFRGRLEPVIVDLIWTSPNHRTMVDEGWLEHGPAIHVHDRCVRLIPPEELIVAKLFVLQKDRCDWTDLFNVLNDQAGSLDWERVYRRVGERDAPLLGGLLSAFRWLCPVDSREIPDSIWTRCGLLPPSEAPDPGPREDRAWVLDSRDWFGPKPIRPPEPPKP
jgi:hypothetical protein